MSHRDVTSSARVTAAAALAVLFASVSPVGATRGPSLRPLDTLTAANGKVWFLQRDGKGTTIDLATGAVTRGGARHDDWPRPPRCDPGATECRLAAGVLTITYNPERERVLRMGSEKGEWQAIHRRRLGPPGGSWEVDGALLISTPESVISTLECLDIASGRARWLYAYPTSWPSSGWTPMGDRDAVSAAREELRRLESEVGDRRAGTFDAADDASGRPYAGAVVLDPDPQRAGAVRVGLLLGWGALVVALVVLAMRAIGRPAGRHVTALVIGLAVVIVAVGLIDPILVGAVWLVFLAVLVVATADKGAPRARLWLIALITAVFVWLPSLIADIQR